MIQASKVIMTAAVAALLAPSGSWTEAKKTIHLCPHSHDDVGWLKTVDQYFDGSAKDIQWTNVANTIETVVNSLLQNPTRRFVQIEMKFFSMWFYEQNEETKMKVRTLVKNGQLEIANAGWSMHDEACPIYEDMINNHMLGHEFVLKEFGVKPRIGWQVDPFGHSNTNAKLFADMGFDAWFFGRQDWADYQKRIKNKELEWVWMPNGDTSKKIFTHRMWESYVWQPIGSFDIRYNNRPFISNQNSWSFNAKQMSEDWLKAMKPKIDAYKTDHIFQPYGDDFAYMNAYQGYTNMDKLIKYINENYKDEYELRYSTPSEYIDALAAMEDVKWPTKYDDLFPYSDQSGDLKSCFWTGYFTSKANLKGQIRETSSYTHAANALFTERVLSQDSSQEEVIKNLVSKYALMDAMGITQHHDAVTGTAKEAVSHDYNFILSRAVDLTQGQYSQVIGEKIRDQTGFVVLDNKWTQCNQNKTTYKDCPISEDLKEEQFKIAMAVHNPSSTDQHSVNILVPKGTYQVQKYGKNGFEPVKSTLTCKEDLDQDLSPVESCSLDVFTNGIGPKEIGLFELFRSSSDFDDSKVVQNDILRIPNNDATVKFVDLDSENGLMKFNIVNRKEKIDETLEIKLKYWPGKTSFDDWKEHQNSGAYIFMPELGTFEALPYTSLISKTKLSDDTMVFTLGKLNDEDELSYQANVTVRAANCVENKVFFKVEVDLFSLPEQPYGGHEVVVEFSNGNLQNNGVFYTDANGMEMQKRILNYRPTWNVQENYDGTPVNITANFYPITSAIQLKDETQKKTFTVMNDRSQAGTSLENGKIQLMQNRRLFADDGRGVGEPLDEMDDDDNGIRVKATYYVELALNGAASSQRYLQQMIDEPAQVFYGWDLQKIEGRTFKSNLTAALKAAGVQHPVKLLTFPAWKNKMIVRLENINDANKTAQVDINAVAMAYWNEANLQHHRSVDQLEIEELSVTANMPITEMQKRKINWQTVDDDKLVFEEPVNDTQDNVKTLKAMQIRVFSVNFKVSRKDAFDSDSEETTEETFIMNN